MDEIKADIDEVYELIKKNIYACVTGSKVVSDVKFHHNISLDKITDALKHGLLSYKQYVETVQKRALTEEEKFIFKDDSHVNGLDDISLSSMDIDVSRMTDDEFLWDTYGSINPDIIVSKDVNPVKITTNYYNEFLAKNKIPVEMFRAVDVRLLRILNYNFSDVQKNSKESKIKLMLQYYELLRQIALILKENNISIPIRETSFVTNNDELDKAIVLDTDKVAELPKITLR